MQIPNRVARSMASIGLLTLQMAAQGQSWDHVASLPPGTEIRIAGPRPAIIRGTLRSVTGDSLGLNSSAGQETFTRQQVTHLSIKKPGHRKLNILIGLGVGAGAGLGIGVGSDRSCAPNGCLFGKNFAKEVFTPLGAGVGALVGALIPSGGWREIYKQ